MKTSIVLLALLILNTSALLSEPLAQLSAGVSTWLLITLEITLLICWYVNHLLKGFTCLSDIDLGGINLIVVGQKKCEKKKI